MGAHRGALGQGEPGEQFRQDLWVGLCQIGSLAGVFLSVQGGSASLVLLS